MVSVAHCHLQRLMSQEFLYYIETNPCLNKPCGKGMPQVVKADIFKGSRVVSNKLRRHARKIKDII